MIYEVIKVNDTILDKEIDTVSLDTQGIRMSRGD